MAGLVIGAAWLLSGLAVASWITSPLRVDATANPVSFGQILRGLVWLAALLNLTLIF